MEQMREIECDIPQKVSSPDDVEMVETAPLPPRHFVFVHLDELQKKLTDCDLKEALYHLRRVRSIFSVAKNEEERNRNRQLQHFPVKIMLLGERGRMHTSGVCLKGRVCQK